MLVTGHLVTTDPGDETRRFGLGSAITDGRGAFDIEQESVATSAEAWDLVLVVAVPGERGRPVELVTETREGAARAEHFRIAISAERLAEAGVELPREATPEERIAAAEAAREVQAKFDAESLRLLGAGLAKAREFREAIAEGLGNFLGGLSAVPEEHRRTGRFGYIPPNADVAVEAVRALGEAAAGPLAAARPTNASVLSDDELNELNSRYPGLTEVPSAALEPIVFPWKKSLPGKLVRIPWTRKCQPPPTDECEQLLGEQPTEDPEPVEPDEPTEPAEPRDGHVEDDVPPDDEPTEPATVEELVHRQADAATPPEVAPGLRPSLDDVQHGVDDFLLRSGPADGPMLVDFHQLRIAFQSVWQELFDKRVRGSATALYEKIAEAGEDPNDYLSTSGGTFERLPPRKLPTPKIPSSVVKAFEITDLEWEALVEVGLSSELETLAKQTTGEDPGEEEDRVKELAKIYDTIAAYAPLGIAIPPPPLPSIAEIRRGIGRQGEKMISYARGRANAPGAFEQFHELLDDLDASMAEPYRFNVYAAGPTGRAFNFAVLSNYRQRWDPVAYQVGELVKTVPLAPKEVRKFTRKTVVKTKREEKESTSDKQSRKLETSDTWRAESQIVANASKKTNFNMKADGGFNVGVANASGSTGASQDTASESNSTKKDFRESIFKATEEYKQERSLKVETLDSTESTTEESGEISNPNDEIPVTYLFYQLQRRHRVSEHLHSVTPVVLVAQEFPDPGDIDDDWIVAHDWMLRESLLDASFLPALTYLATKVVGDEVALRELHDNLQQHRRTVEKLTDDTLAIRSQIASRYTSLELAIAKHADAIAEDEDSGEITPMPVGFLVSGSDVSVDATRLREEAARDALERAAKQEKEMQARLDREVTALASLSETYTKELATHLNRKAQITRLRVHIKQNIYYYMQAIWSREPDDQRFFRLHDVPIPRLVGKKTYKIEPDPDAVPLPPDWKKPQKLTVTSELDTDKLEYDALGEVAELDNLLGFKGNFMIFPMRRGNDLTDTMMTPYYAKEGFLADPDPLGNWTLRDFVDYVCCLRKELSKEAFERRLPGLIEMYRMLKERDAENDEVIVPTESLYIEALPGVRPVLEDFKLLHRAVDVKKAQAEVRGLEMENVRMAARLLSGEREDPTIEKKVVIEGAEAVVIPDDGA
ncbi:MAG: hypothetical protein GEU94_03360 [Micromonosporaceae bacterium]|nr:hypothetical protein [Micromonosporaceae bacterium]